MSEKLDHRQLTLIKRVAEDACYAMNRHYKPFIEEVAKPLMIISLVEMAQSRQDELDQAYADIETFAQAHQRECDIKVQIANELKDKNKRIEQLQAKVDAVEHVLGCAMIGPKEVFQYADRISKAIRGES